MSSKKFARHTELLSNVQDLAGSNVAQPNSAGKLSQRRRADLIPGVIGGERVLLHKPGPPREKAIEIRIRVALAAAGVMVMKHNIDRRSPFGMGLGIGVADLICVVPPMGRFLGIEVKRPGYSPSDVRDEQRRWLAIVKRAGGVTGIATSEAEALALVEEARRGLV